MNQNIDFKEILMPYMYKWKFIALCVIAALTLGFLYLRYADYQYQATAKIKIKENENNNRLPEISQMQNYGLFRRESNNVLDEIEVMKSRVIIEQAVKELKFNIQYFVEGRIKASEAFSSPPLNINFSAPDSIIHNIDTTFNIKIQSKNDFLLKGINFSEKFSFKNDEDAELDDEGTVYSFGESIPTSFGAITITPRIGESATKPGANIKIKITPISKVVSKYKSNLIISNHELSSIITLSINDNVAEKATLFLDKLIEKYNLDVQNDKQMVVDATSDFINNRLEIVTEELGDVDINAENIQKSNKLTDLATQSNIYLESERENENRLVETAMQIQLIDYMNQHIKEDETDSKLLPANIGIADGSIEQLTQQYNNLVLEKNRLLKNSSDKNPTIVNLTTQINQLKSNLTQSLSNMKHTNEMNYSSLAEENRRISSRIYSAPKKQRQFRDIKRQQDIKEGLYLYLLEKREEAAITHGVTSPNAKIVDKAFASNKPVAPKQPIILLTAIILGFGFPIVLIYLFNLLDDKVHNINDVKKEVTIPFIGDIPKTGKKNKLISKIDYSPKAEAFRMVRTNLKFLLQNIEDRARVIFITSTTSQEGKSHTATNLALSLSFTEKKVLLIETDIRVPKATNYLDVDNTFGLTNFIGNNKVKVNEIIFKHKDNPYFDIIPSGTIPPNPAELLMNKRVKELFDEVSTQYDYVIVDTAAVGLVTDTLLISKFADLFIYVVKANYITKKQLQIAQRMHTEKRLPNMNILLNSVDHKKGYGYGYGYGTKPVKKKWWKVF
ncbi:polysaccharide biosynthesis tyrosine autokinase [Xanthomarina sp. F1114]|uniref:GumC family protein n=1 Tax=Xanthomarina sp. F1114 TaxID=2996019 RepID=UPI00225E4156|nr:polysaccharide biosynthesis tyrosine autokinase [Xanthomarina sp. F1114]MCX7548378.1 polysaccharide biosynthesis tyrosine autokinase [Xanthomarina sp. F1114]